MVKVSRYIVVNLGNDEVNAGDLMQSTVNNVVKHMKERFNLSGKVHIVVHESGDKVIQPWDAPNRRIAQDIRVYVQGQDVQAEQALLGIAKASQDSGEPWEHVGVRRPLNMQSLLRDVRNVAVQIIFIATDVAGFKRTQCTRFQTRGVEDENVLAVAAALGVEPEYFISNSDKMVTRRNSDFHYGSVADLDMVVAYVIPRITDAIKAKASWECRIIFNYANIKKAFPGVFKPLTMDT